ncbi:MAG: hypothetical protein ACLUI3_06460 [Christensenellales bacterium]
MNKEINEGMTDTEFQAVLKQSKNTPKKRKALKRYGSYRRMQKEKEHFRHSVSSRPRGNGNHAPFLLLLFIMANGCEGKNKNG